MPSPPGAPLLEPSSVERLPGGGRGRLGAGEPKAEADGVAGLQGADGETATKPTKDMGIGGLAPPASPFLPLLFSGEIFGAPTKIAYRKKLVALF